MEWGRFLRNCLVFIIKGRETEWERQRRRRRVIRVIIKLDAEEAILEEGHRHYSCGKWNGVLPVRRW